MTNDELCGAETTNGGTCQNKAESCPWHGVENPPDNGRPTKLTKEVVDNITTHIAEGKSDNAAFRLEDLHPSTKGNWLGKVDPEEVPKDPDFDSDPYGYFFRRYTHARGLGEDFYFSTVIEMAEEAGDHRFVASLMKQRYGDSWAETDTGVEADTVNVEVSERVRNTFPE
jgi:hypothetical protein